MAELTDIREAVRRRYAQAATASSATAGGFGSALYDAGSRGELPETAINASFGCVAGALTDAEFRAILHHAGFRGIEIRPTHSVHAHASAAIIRARKPGAATSRG